MAECPDKHTRGPRAARLLARLDRMWFEGTLNGSLDQTRMDLFVALQKEDIPEVERITSDLDHILNIPADTKHPLLAWASRIVEGKELLAQKRVGTKKWESFRSQVRQANSHADLARLDDLLKLASSRNNVS